MISVAEKVRLLNPLVFNSAKIKEISPSEYLGIDFKQYVTLPEESNGSKNLIGALLSHE